MLAGAQWDRLWTCKASLWWKQPSSRGLVQSWSRQSICSSWPAGRGAWTHTLQGKEGNGKMLNYSLEKLLNALEFDFPWEIKKQRARYLSAFAPLPGWRVCAKVSLILCIEQNKVSHGSQIQVDQDNVLHLPASALQLTWTKTTHYNTSHSSLSALCKW